MKLSRPGLFEVVAMRKTLSLVLFTVCLSLTLAEGQSVPSRYGRLPYTASLPTSNTWKPDMVYHGGPIMAGPINLYVVYYGSFSAKQHSILDTFLQHVGGSKAFNVTTEYYDSQGQSIANVLNYDPTTDSYDDAYSLGQTLSGDFFETTLLHNAALVTLSFSIVHHIHVSITIYATYGARPTSLYRQKSNHCPEEAECRRPYC